MYLDFCKTFGLIPHDTMIKKLEQYKINMAHIKWIKSWLYYLLMTWKKNENLYQQRQQITQILGRELNSVEDKSLREGVTSITC